MLTYHHSPEWCRKKILFKLFILHHSGEWWYLESLTTKRSFLVYRLLHHRFSAQNEVKNQISKVEKTIVDKQKIVNTYVNKVEAPWENREAIIGYPFNIGQNGVHRGFPEISG